MFRGTNHQRYDVRHDAFPDPLRRREYSSIRHVCHELRTGRSDATGSDDLTALFPHLAALTGRSLERVRNPLLTLSVEIFIVFSHSKYKPPVLQNISPLPYPTFYQE
jgi:hypothetical protein